MHRATKQHNWLFKLNNFISLHVSVLCFLTFLTVNAASILINHSISPTCSDLCVLWCVLCRSEETRQFSASSFFSYYFMWCLTNFSRLVVSLLLFLLSVSDTDTWGSWYLVLKCSQFMSDDVEADLYMSAFLCAVRNMQNKQTFNLCHS